jgi:hypothetical protein
MSPIDIQTTPVPHRSKGVFHDSSLPWFKKTIPTLQLQPLVLLDVSHKAKQQKLCSYTFLYYCTLARKRQTRFCTGAALPATTRLPARHPSSPFHASCDLGASPDDTKDGSDAPTMMAQSWDPHRTPHIDTAHAHSNKLVCESAQPICPLEFDI